tara:strand:+ start:1205 stop:1393 length:189 start_codon:yes stop_codon:yes gene_type:complete
MNCPHCGKEMELRVEVTIKLPARYTNLLSKKAIREKECQLVAANWEKARVICYDCNYREKGL